MRLGASAHYAAAFKQILRDPISPDVALARLRNSVENRGQIFLYTLERGVYANPRSPYRRLLEHAGLAIEDVRRLVAEAGLEGALERLYAAGVYVTAAEFKGRAPVVRPGLEFAVSASDFDNPIADSHFRGNTSGSSGAPTQVFIGFDIMEHEASYYSLLFDSQGSDDRPLAYWHAALHTALKTTFRHAKAGHIARKWFTPTPFRWTPRGLKEQYVVALTLLLSRLYRRPVPIPEYVPRGQVLKVAQWLALQTRAGHPALLETNHSQAVRVCLAAEAYGLNIAGTAFHLTGEPFTPAKADVMRRVGARGLDRYANVELGAMGVACLAPSSHDDTHLMIDKLAVITPADGSEPREIVMTGLLPSTPKLMLNVHTGDYATMEPRHCGCPFDQAGLGTHLSHIRARDKLTGEGATFPTTPLLTLLEEVLPARFGGAPTDYQLVEEEEGGLTRASLVVRESVGRLNEPELLSVVYEALSRFSVDGAAEWRQSSTLRVVRRNPYETSSAKILPLHVVR
jgi:hypothetical protein